MLPKDILFWMFDHYFDIGARYQSLQLGHFFRDRMTEAEIEEVQKQYVISRRSAKAVRERTKRYRSEPHFSKEHVVCDWCLTAIKAKNLQKHKETGCPQKNGARWSGIPMLREIPCGNHVPKFAECRFSGLAFKVAIHKTTCKIKCNYCKAKYTMEDAIDHHRSFRCSKAHYDFYCDNCERMFPRKKMADHQNGRCENIRLSCFKCGRMFEKNQLHRGMCRVCGNWVPTLKSGFYAK